MREWAGTGLLSKPKDRRVAALLALAGAIAPVSGFHKFYIGQPIWGVIYLLMGFTPIPRVASAIEALWYLSQDPSAFDSRFNDGASALPTSGTPAKAVPKVDPEKVGAIADAVRQLDQLRADGLISEYEFEQKRRQLLDQIA